MEFREEGEEWDHIHLPGDRSSFYLTGLKGSTRYELRLAAYNVFGRGEFSPTIDFTTGLAGKFKTKYLMKLNQFKNDRSNVKYICNIGNLINSS